MEKEKHTINNVLIKYRPVVFLLIFIFTLVFALQFFFIWEGDESFAVPTGQGGGEIIRGDLKLEQGTTWRRHNGEDLFKIFVKGEGDNGELIPDDFIDTLIIETTDLENENSIEACFYDATTNRMIQCWNHGEADHATTIYRSLQVVGNDKLPNDEGFTYCAGYNDIDCATDTTGADLGVEDDIEAKGSVFVQEEIKVGGVFEDGANKVLCVKSDDTIGTCDDALQNGPCNCI